MFLRHKRKRERGKKKKKLEGDKIEVDVLSLLAAHQSIPATDGEAMSCHKGFLRIDSVPDAWLRGAVSSVSDSRARAGFNTQSGPILLFLLPLFQEGQLSVTGESNTKNWVTA